MTRPPMTVSDLARSIRETIDDAFPPVWVEGEVANYIRHRSGHHYFSIRDSDCQLACVLWRGRARQIPLELHDGLRVRLYVQISFYDRGGRLQLDVQQLQPSGVGELLLRFEQLKEKLRQEGLFDLERKKELPAVPTTLGVVTSPDGAAIRDISEVIRQRFPGISLQLYPALVQGEGAAAEVAAGVRYFNRKREVDLVIVSRGGGSLEDLWAFNDEQLARTIAASNLPVISGVGHEVDTTIADLAADVRAVTPSNAAELAVPDAEALQQRLQSFRRQLERRVRFQLSGSREQLQQLRRAITPRRLLFTLTARAQHLDELQLRLAQGVRWRHQQELTFLKQQRLQLKNLFLQNLSHLRQRVESYRKLLEVINPQQVLERGYALVEETASGNLIQDKKQISTGDNITVNLRRGRLFARVEAKGD